MTDSNFYRSSRQHLADELLKLDALLEFHVLRHREISSAPELDVKYEKLYAYLQDDVTKKSPSVNLILDLLCGSTNREERIDAHICFFDQSPLLKYQLVKFTNDGDSHSKPLLSRCLNIDERIAHFLLGFNVMDSRLSSYAKIINPQKEWTSLVMEDKLKKQLIGLANDYFESYFMKTGKRGLVFYLKGPYGAGKKSTAEAICHQLELPLIIVDTRDLLVLNSETGFEKPVKRFFREAILHSAAIYFEDFDRLVTDDHDRKGDIYRKTIIRAVEEFSFITFFAGEKEWYSQGELKNQAFVTVELPVPAYPLRKHLWKKFVNDIDIDGVANKFNFTGGQIRDAAVEAGNLAIIRCCGDNNGGGITMEDLYRGCSRQSNRKLSEMARKIKPRYTWSDIVLPGDKLQQLKEIRNYVKYRQVIYHDWGFDRKLSLGKGLNILFSGLSGTGKTMAADVIANELHLDYYKIDLSCVVSKYIGEPVDKPFPSPVLLKEVKGRLIDRSINTLSASNILVQGPGYVEVSISARIVPVSYEDAPVLETVIIDRMREYLHPLTGGPEGWGWEFGRDLYISDVYAFLEAIPGVDHAANLQLNGKEEDVTVNEYQTLCSREHKIVVLLEDSLTINN